MAGNGTFLDEDWVLNPADGFTRKTGVTTYGGAAKAGFPLFLRADGYLDGSIHPPGGIPSGRTAPGPERLGLPNSNFEDGLTGWTVAATGTGTAGQVDGSAGNQVTGVNSIKMTLAASGDTATLTSPMFPCGAGIPFYAFVRAKSAGAKGTLTVSIAFLGYNGTALTSGTPVVLATQALLPAAFAEYGAPVVPPIGACYAQITVQASAAADTVWVDEVRAGRGTTLGGAANNNSPVVTNGLGQIDHSLYATVTTIAALRLVSGKVIPAVAVQGYYAPGDGDGGEYIYQPGDTTSADNGGTIIVASDGSRFALDHRGPADLRQFGAYGDCVQVSSQVTTTANSAALVVGTAMFLPTDVGKSIVVPGAGSSGSALVTTIAAFVSSTQVTLSSTASTAQNAVQQTITFGHDDTAAVRQAFGLVNACITDNRGGNYILYTPGVISFGNETRFFGSGRGMSSFTVISTSYQVFSLAGIWQGMWNFGMTSVVPQVLGSRYVLLAGIENVIENFTMSNHFVGIYMTGAISRILHGRMAGIQAGGTGIDACGGDTSQLIDDVIMGAEANPNTAQCGFRVRNSSGLMIVNSQAIQQGIGLLIDPTSNTTSASDPTLGNVASLNVTNCFFDTGGSAGIKILCQGTALVTRLRFTQCWTCSGQGDGVLINNVGNGNLNGIVFLGHHALFNSNGSGLSTTGAVADVQVLGGEFGGNKYGVFLSSGSQNIRIIGSAIGGAAADAGVNISGGVVVNSGVNNFEILGCDLSSQSNPILDSSTSPYKVVDKNIGYNPTPAVVLAQPTSSPFNYTNRSGAPQLVYVNGGTISAITVDGAGAAGAGNNQVVVPHNRAVVVTFTGNPNIYVSGL